MASPIELSSLGPPRVSSGPLGAARRSRGAARERLLEEDVASFWLEAPRRLELTLTSRDTGVLCAVATIEDELEIAR